MGQPFSGSCWTAVLDNELGLSDVDVDVAEGNAPTNECVLILIGGGHYVPKMNDALRLGKGIHAGHMLATYTLSQFFTPAPEAPEGQGSRGSGDDSTHAKVETSLSQYISI